MLTECFFIGLCFIFVGSLEFFMPLQVLNFLIGQADLLEGCLELIENIYKST